MNVPRFTACRRRWWPYGALLGHASLDTTARYFRAGAAEQAAVVERVFE
jgi:hypothetical protein